jgi:FkbM family methyltransferase
MGANSLPRRVVKRLTAPLLGDTAYSVLQAAAMGWDMRRGAWFEPEIDYAKTVVRTGDTVIDVGANFGLWAYHLSRMVGPTGRVHSFEPIPFTARTFRLVARGLGFSSNTTLHAVGCGEKNETSIFKVPVMDTGAISAGLVHMPRNDDRPGRETFARFPSTKDIACRVVRIDDHLPNVERVTLFKCDIEGADLYALRGARRLLERNRPMVVLEITPWFLEGFGLAVADVTGFLRELGYHPHRFGGGRLFPVKDEQIVEGNWVFVPENTPRSPG